MHFNFPESQKGYVITSANVENEDIASFYGLMLTLNHGNAMSCYIQIAVSYNHRT